MRLGILGLLVALALGLPSATLATDLKAERHFRDTLVSFKANEKYEDTALSISGPNGFHATAHGRGELPSIDLQKFGRPEDGLYRYQLNAATSETVKNTAALDNGRDSSARRDVRRGADASGVFWVKNGLISQFDSNQREDGRRPK